MHQSDRTASILLTPVPVREPRLGDLPELLKVLADPTRLRIIAFLAQRELCVCDLEAQLGISQSMTSHHLGVLRRAGLLLQRREDRDARWVYYRLNPDAVAELQAAVNGLLDLSHFDSTPASLPSAKAMAVRSCVQAAIRCARRRKPGLESSVNVVREQAPFVHTKRRARRHRRTVQPRHG